MYRPPAHPATGCPDCGRAPDLTGPTPTLRHDASCPIGRGLDAATAGDRDYFLDNPGTTVRERPCSWAERAQQIALGATPAQLNGARVIVTAVTPGFRLRRIVPARRGST